jgi:flagellar FliJ protein
MKTPSPLIMLRHLALDAEKQAAQQLGQTRQAQQTAEQQLTMLLNYQEEYQQKLTITLGDGIGFARWQNYQQFINTLEQAIAQHHHQLLQWNQKVEQAVGQWQSKQQKLNAFNILHTRSVHAEQQRENKREQKQMDEFAQRSVARDFTQ